MCKSARPKFPRLLIGRWLKFDLSSKRIFGIILLALIVTMSDRREILRQRRQMLRFSRSEFDDTIEWMSSILKE